MSTKTNNLVVFCKIYKKYEKKLNEAVTCLEPLYSGEFFVAGFYSGSVAIYSIENCIPLSLLSNIYDSPCNLLLTVEPGKFFISVGEDKIRYHFINEINHERIE